MSTAKISPLYLEIGKALAEQLVIEYAQTQPGAVIALTALDNIMKAQAAVAAHNAIIVRAQKEGWSETDPRWDAPLAEQQSRMDVENARHDGFE
jgi:hypothetical protein